MRMTYGNKCYHLYSDVDIIMCDILTIHLLEA